MRNLKRILSAALAMVMSLSIATVASAAVDFKDAEDINYDEAVAVMSTIGVLEGYNGEFDPAGSLTREQAAKIIAYMLLGNDANKLSVADSRYKDVAANRWSAGCIEYCSELGILAGNGDGTFAPEAKLTGYAFAKMLLGALGYKSDIEGFTGSAWTLNVATYAHEVGLDAGIEDMKWGEEISRETAAQMAMNAVKSPLVQYKSGSTIIINGEKVTFGSGDAYYVTSTLAKEQRISTQKLTNSNDYTVEFGERYFPKLELKATTDAFGRPARTWSYDREEIGTYADTTNLVETYTTTVKGSELYELLGKTVVDDYSFTIYADGVEQPAAAANQIVKNNKTNFDLSGNGALTQVFVDKDSEDVIITVINTYLAIATADYNTKAETASFDIYGVQRVGGEFVRVVKGNNAEDKVPSVKVENDDVAVSEIKKDDVVLVTLAKGAVQSVDAAEVVSDVTITSFTKNSKIVADGETYNYAVTTDYNYEVLDAYSDNNMKEKTYNVYLDTYGNLIGLEYVVAADNYVFITAYDQNGSNLSNKTWSANAIFLDGKTEVIEVKNNGALASANNENTEKQVNKWYTYTVSNGVYTLSLVNTAWASGDKVAQSVVDDTSAVSIDYKNPSLHVTTGTKPYVYGNNDSVYLTAKLGKVDNYTVITGASSVSTGIKNTSIVTYAGDGEKVDGTNTYLNSAAYVLFKSNGYIIGAVVVGEDAAVSKNLVYVNSDSPSLESYNSTDDTWTWTREVIHNGEKIELTEVGSDLTYLGTSDMVQYDWYVVSYDAAGNVTGTKRMTADEVNIKYVTSYTGGAIQTAINTGVETVLYEQNFTNNALLPRLIEQTLYMDNNAANGFFIAEDATVVLIQKNDGEVTTTYDVGPAAIEYALDNLNANAGGNYDYELSAVIERGAAEVVIINDTTNGNAGSGNKPGKDPVVPENVTITGLTINVPVANGYQTSVTDKAIAALQAEGYTVTKVAVDGRDATGNVKYTLEASKNGVSGYTFETLTTVYYLVSYANSGSDTWVYSGPAYVKNGQTVTITASNTAATPGTAYKFASTTGSVATFSQVTGTATAADKTSTFNATLTVSNDGVIKILASF